MKPGIFTVIVCCFFVTTFSQKIKNDFFTLQNIIRGDSTYNNFDKQVTLLKHAGYDGTEIDGIENFEEMHAVLDKQHYKASYFYMKVTLDEPYIDGRMQGYIQQLKGSKTILTPYFVNNALNAPGTRGADTLVIRLLKQLADWAADAGLQVAVYPHLGYYVQRTDHALELVKAVNRKNVGLVFNLCHWLATTSASERGQLQSHLRELRPYLKMITICGANDVITQQKNPWADYILPLGTGSFDTYGLLKFCLKDLKLEVPVGVQCYNIKTNKYELVLHTMNVLDQYKQRLLTEK